MDTGPSAWEGGRDHLRIVPAQAEIGLDEGSAT